MIASLKLPLVQATLAANVRGTSVITVQLDFVKDNFSLKPSAVIADS